MALDDGRSYIAQGQTRVEEGNCGIEDGLVV